MAEQLSFDLPARTALGRDDFFVSSSNALAVAMIDGDWPGGKLLLSGPVKSGKTHLAHVWAAQSGAQIVPAADLTEDRVPALALGPVVVEDVDRIADDPTAQAALFHLHNLVLASGHRLMMTGRGAPHRWGLSLPDLQSRIQGTQVAELQPPDDLLLSALLAKLFNDRQIMPKPNVIPYLVGHMDRSFEAATAIVEELDKLSLREARNMSRPLAVRLLGKAAEKD